MQGLSICIPVYNWDVTSLVVILHRQAEQLGIPFEVIVADDCSQIYQSENKRELELLSNARYLCMQHNVGRSRIRNFLTQSACYEWVLFMDCDVEVCSADYVRSYWEERKNAQLVVGGVSYHKQKPSRERLLRWEYGVKVEERSAEQRNRNPFQSFVPFNFMIRRELLLCCPFDEKFSKYGHEDTLLGYELSRNGVTIKHIDNPLIHLGVDETEVFLNKTRQSVENLLMIQRDPHVPSDLLDSIHLLKFYRRLSCLHLDGLARWFFRMSEKRVLKNLKGITPSIHLFQWYKLGYLLERVYEGESHC